MVAEVEWESNRRCCVCHRDRDTQLHHVDDDPANNVFNNLALLCLECHDKATRTGGLTRSLSAATIRRFRVEWYAYVRELREARRPRRSRRSRRPQGSTGDAAQMLVVVVEGNAIHEIRRVRHELGAAHWSAVPQLLDSLVVYGDTLSYGPSVGIEYLMAIEAATGRARHGDPDAVARVAGRIADAAMRAFPIYSFVGRQARRSTKAELEVLRLGGHIGSDFAYDGAKWLRELRVVEAGSDLLWRVLRFAHLNEERGLERFARSEFAKVEGAARDVRAREWIEFRRLDALSDPDGEPPELPAEAYAELQAAWRATRGRE
jgi:hypothetical protein